MERNVFKPHPWQVNAWKDKSKVLLLEGGAGGGKSKIAAEKMNAYMKNYPESMGLVVRKARESMKNSVVLMFEEEIIKHDSDVRHNKQDHRFEYGNGSKLVWAGMKDEAQREAIRSIGQKGGLDFIWMEEANKFSKDDFTELLGRLRGMSASWRQIILTTNTDGPKHWINQDLILGGKATVIRSFAKDNLEYNASDYQDTLNEMDGVLGKRLREGLWVQAEGVIYKMFNQELHVKNDLLKLQDYKYLIGGADANFPKPRAAVLIGVRGTGQFDLIDEFYRSNTEVEELGKWFSEWGIKAKRTIIVYHDPSDPQAIVKINRNSMVKCMKAKNPVLPGISVVSGLFKNGRLIVNPRCFETISCLQSYAWKKGAENEVPDKVEDHLADSLRYALYSFLNVGRFAIGRFA